MSTEGSTEAAVEIEPQALTQEITSMVEPSIEVVPAPNPRRRPYLPW